MFKIGVRIFQLSKLIELETIFFFTETDLLPLIVTLVCALLTSLEYGIIIGIATNLVFILYSSARPKIIIDQYESNVYLVKFKTGLHFAASNYIREYILKNCDGEKCTVVIDGFNIGNIDATVAKVRIIFL